MKDQSKTKKTLIRELDAQKMRIAELEKLESDHKQVEEIAVIGWIAAYQFVLGLKAKLAA